MALPALGQCESVGFSPSLEITTSTDRADAPTGLGIALDLPQDEDPDGLATSHLRSAAVTLPPGFSLSPGVAQGLSMCTDAQLAIGDPVAATCPSGRQAGHGRDRQPLVAGAASRRRLPRRGGATGALPHLHRRRRPRGHHQAGGPAAHRPGNRPPHDGALGIATAAGEQARAQPSGTARERRSPRRRPAPAGARRRPSAPTPATPTRSPRSTSPRRAAPAARPAEEASRSPPASSPAARPRWPAPTPPSRRRSGAATGNSRSNASR